MFDRFSDDARKAMDLARQAARDRNHAWIGTEHILLGLVALTDCTATTVLAGLGIDGARIQAEVDATMPRGSSEVSGPQPLTPRSMNALNLANEAASAVDRDPIDTDHLLLGLMAETEGVAAQVLARLGVTVEQVRARITPAAAAVAVVLPVPRPPGRFATWMTHWSFWPVYAGVVLLVLFLARPWEQDWVWDSRGIKLHMGNVERAGRGCPLGSVLVAGESAGSPGEEWLRCDGRQVPRSEWRDLAELLPDGAGADSDHFSLPDYEGLWISGTPPQGMVWNVEVGREQAKPETVQPKEHVRFWVKARR